VGVVARRAPAPKGRARSDVEAALKGAMIFDSLERRSMQPLRRLAFAVVCSACGSSPAPQASAASPPEASAAPSAQQEQRSFRNRGDHCKGTVPKELHAAIEERARTTTSCYEEALAADPDLDTDVRLVLTIDYDGTLREDGLFEEHGSETPLRACLKSRLASHPFDAKPRDGCVWISLSGERLDENFELLMLSIVY